LVKKTNQNRSKKKKISSIQSILQSRIFIPVYFSSPSFCALALSSNPQFLQITHVTHFSNQMIILNYCPLHYAAPFLCGNPVVLAHC
jgi:hypothetical protein